MHFQYHTLFFLVSVQKYFCSYEGGNMNLSERNFFRETRIEIALSFNDFDSKQL